MEKTFPIYGMHCKSCEKRISDEISSIEGVSSVDVKLKRQSAAVSYDSNVSDKDIEDALLRLATNLKLANRRFLAVILKTI